MASQGVSEGGAYLPSSTIGGARKADEVIDQTNISPTSTAADTPPASGAYGINRNAMHEAVAMAAIHRPSCRMPRATRSAATPSVKSITMKMIWSAIKIPTTHDRAMPADSASAGRNTT